MSGSNRNLPLPQFIHSSLSPLVPIFSDLVPSSTASSQALLKLAADDLYLIGRMISSLGLYSENEEADELGERELLFMATAWVLGEVEGRRGIEVRGSSGSDENGNQEIGLEGRMGAVKRADTAFQSFLHLLVSYKILSDEEVSESASLAQNVAPTFGTGAGSAARIAPRDPAKRREEKIRAYKREKELRSGISSTLPGDVDPSSHPLAFILPLLPPPGSPSDSEEELPISRSTLISLLRLLYTLTLSSLSSNAMELELLSSAPSPSHQRPASSSSNPRDRSNPADTDTTWRLDRAPAIQRAGDRHGGLISGGGRVLRPFTILPSTSQMSDRERLKSEVFRSGHALPSMTIDEYLEEEMRRGGIISGGGQASADAPTTSELLQLASENDGTLEGEDKEEEKRLKDENWARFTDENRKGAGNTMNRG